MFYRTLIFSSLVLGLALTLIGCTTRPACKSNRDCVGKAPFCVDGSCKRCRDDKDCGKNPCVVCQGKTYTCQRRTPCCTTDLNCPNGRCWIKKGHSFGKCGPQCTADKHCGPNYQCRDSICVAKLNELRPQPGCLKTVYFDYDESVLNEDARRVMDQNIRCMKRSSLHVKLAGHCDERGTTEYNLALGQRRAGTTKAYLVNAGILATRLATISFGKERPVCSEQTETCWKRNRRVEFIDQ